MKLFKNRAIRKSLRRGKYNRTLRKKNRIKKNRKYRNTRKYRKNRGGLMKKL
jgi:hypothetical protein